MINIMAWYFSKWLSFSAAAMVLLSAGLAYTFSIYSDALKKSFNLSQTQIAGIGTACNLGGYLALPAGLVFDALKRYNRCIFHLPTSSPRKLASGRFRHAELYHFATFIRFLLVSGLLQAWHIYLYLCLSGYEQVCPLR